MLGARRGRDLLGLVGRPPEGVGVPPPLARRIVGAVRALRRNAFCKFRPAPCASESCVRLYMSHFLVLAVWPYRPRLVGPQRARAAAPSGARPHTGAAPVAAEDMGRAGLAHRV